MNRIPSPIRENPRTEMPGEFEPPVRIPVRDAIRPIDDGRERLRSGASNVNPFEIGDIVRAYAPTGGRRPEGEIDLNWKRYEVYGKRDYAEMRVYEEQGWRAVQHEMFPGRFAPEGTTGPIIVKDMILMERPMRLTIQARQEELDAANRAMQVHQKAMAETPEGQAPRMRPVLRSTREAIEIPE
jgi:hypothetical protein